MARVPDPVVFGTSSRLARCLTFIHGWEPLATQSMEPRERFSTNPRVRGLGRQVRRFYPVVLLALGIALALVALTSEVELVGQEERAGSAPPGDTARNVTRTDYGAVVLDSNNLPCPVLVYPLAPLEFGAYMQDGTLPPVSLDCDRETLGQDHQISHLIVRNVDPFDSLNYSLTLTFFRTITPLAWVALPALALLSAGSIILLLRMFLGGLEKAIEPPRRKE